MTRTGWGWGTHSWSVLATGSHFQRTGWGLKSVTLFVSQSPGKGKLITGTQQPEAEPAGGGKGVFEIISLDRAKF